MSGRFSGWKGSSVGSRKGKLKCGNEAQFNNKETRGGISDSRSVWTKCFLAVYRKSKQDRQKWDTALNCILYKGQQCSMLGLCGSGHSENTPLSKRDLQEQQKLKSAHNGWLQNDKYTNGWYQHALIQLKLQIKSCTFAVTRANKEHKS